MELQCQDNFCIANEYHMSLRSAHLEIAYEKTLCQMRQVLDGEKTRLFRVERLLLEADNEGLHTQLKHAEEELFRVMEVESNIRQELLGARREIAYLQQVLRANSQEIEDLKKEITSLNSSSLESKKLLSEKLRLSRELSSLQPELERLKAQSASYQTLLSEKLALERQLNSLEVQLETERRAFERAQVRDSKQKEDVSIDAQLQDLRNKVANEARERQRIERENHELKNEWESQRTALENKLEVLRKKLRSTKDRLKEAQNELNQRHCVVKNEGTSEFGQRVLGVPFQRTTGRFDPDMTIATPGAVQVAEKSKRPSALPGDKSAFSITPFLSRTSAAPDSPMSSSDDVDGRRTTEASHGSDNATGIGDSPDGKSINHQPRDSGTSVADITWDQKDQKQEAGMDQMSIKEKPAKISELSDRGDPPLDHNNESLNEVSVLGRSKPRRRKLLGTQRDRTLFDDEDDTHGGRRQGWKPTLGTGRNFVPDSSQLSATSTAFPPGIRRGFGSSMEFSPLKRDRKRL